MILTPLVLSSLANNKVHQGYFFPWNRTSVTCPTPVVIEPPSNNWRLDNIGQYQTSLSGQRSRRDQSKERNRHKKRRRRRSSSSSSFSSYSSPDSPKRKSRRLKHSHKKRRRRYTSSSSSSVSHSRIRDYGRYQRNRYSPQAVQDPQVPQPEVVPNIQTITPEQVISRPSRFWQWIRNLVLW